MRVVLDHSTVEATSTITVVDLVPMNGQVLALR